MSLFSLQVRFPAWLCSYMQFSVDCPLRQLCVSLAVSSLCVCVRCHIARPFKTGFVQSLRVFESPLVLKILSQSFESPWKSVWKAATVQGCCFCFGGGGCVIIVMDQSPWDRSQWVTRTKARFSTVLTLGQSWWAETRQVRKSKTRLEYVGRDFDLHHTFVSTHCTQRSCLCKLLSLRKRTSHKDVCHSLQSFLPRWL